MRKHFAPAALQKDLAAHSLPSAIRGRSASHHVQVKAAFAMLYRVQAGNQSGGNRPHLCSRQAQLAGRASWLLLRCESRRRRWANAVLAIRTEFWRTHSEALQPARLLRSRCPPTKQSERNQRLALVELARGRARKSWIPLNRTIAAETMRGTREISKPFVKRSQRTPTLDFTATSPRMPLFRKAQRGT